MKLPGVIGQRLSWSTNGSPPSTRPAHSVPRSTGVTPDSPRAQAAQATSASPWMSVNGSEPRPCFDHGPEGQRLVIHDPNVRLSVVEQPVRDERVYRDPGPEITDGPQDLGAVGSV